jgi:hypothetical protein
MQMPNVNGGQVLPRSWPRNENEKLQSRLEMPNVVSAKQPADNPSGKLQRDQQAVGGNEGGTNKLCFNLKMGNQRAMATTSWTTVTTTSSSVRISLCKAKTVTLRMMTWTPLSSSSLTVPMMMTAPEMMLMTVVAEEIVGGAMTKLQMVLCSHRQRQVPLL